MELFVIVNTARFPIKTSVKTSAADRKARSAGLSLSQ
jgi:hypothetical protein